MSFAEVAFSFRHRREKPAPPSLGDRLRLLDVNDLPGLSRRLKELRDQIADLKEEEERIAKHMNVHRDCKVGYSNEYIKVIPIKSPDLEDPKLLALLEAKGLMGRVTETKISAPLLKEIADEHDDVAKAIRWNVGRQIRKKGKRKDDD